MKIADMLLEEQMLFVFDLILIFAMITLIFSRNNIISLLALLSYLLVISFELCISATELSLLILLIYVGALLVIFLVNGVLLISSITIMFGLLVCYYTIMIELLHSIKEGKEQITR